MKDHADKMACLSLAQVVVITCRRPKCIYICAVLRCPTSKISSRDTSMRQCPAWGCCWESSCRRIFSFCTRSLLYLGTVRHSASSGRFPGDSTDWACSFSWLTRLHTHTHTQREMSVVKTDVFGIFTYLITTYTQYSALNISWHVTANMLCTHTDSQCQWFTPQLQTVAIISHTIHMHCVSRRRCCFPCDISTVSEPRLNMTHQN